MSKRRKWKGTEPVARTAEQWEKLREYEAMSDEEKNAEHRKQFVNWLERLKGSESIINIDGKPQEHNPMSDEEADLHLALFDKKIKPTREVRTELAQFELLRFQKSKRALYKYWKLAFPHYFVKNI